MRHGNPDALHQTRVASRRLRELLPLLRLEADTTRALKRRLKRVTRELGSVRELDVLASMLEDLHSHPQYSSFAVQHVAALVSTERAAAMDRLAARLPEDKLERIVRRLETVIRDRRKPGVTPGPRITAARDVWITAVEARVAFRAGRVRAAIDAAGGIFFPERLHRVRIGLKKLRYAVELLAEGRRRSMTADLNVLKTAQALLGRLRDLEVLIGRTHQTQASMQQPLNLAVWGELGALADAVEADCRRLHGRYMRARQKLITVADRLATATGTGTRRAAG